MVTESLLLQKKKKKKKITLESSQLFWYTFSNNSICTTIDAVKRPKVTTSQAISNARINYLNK